jgi:hypothetical protein
VVHDEVDDHPDAARLGGADEFDEVAERAEARIDGEEVDDVVAVVLAGGRIERHEPQAGHAEIGQILDPLAHPTQVAAAVAVPVVEGLDVGAVEHGVLPPQVAGIGLPHAIAALVDGAVGDSWGNTCSPKASMKPACC